MTADKTAHLIVSSKMVAGQYLGKLLHSAAELQGSYTLMTLQVPVISQSTENLFSKLRAGLLSNNVKQSHFATPPPLAGQHLESCIRFWAPSSRETRNY